MDTLWHDIRHSLRGLRSNRGVTAVALVTLALGIGANTAIFSVVNAVLLRPLPYSDAERLVRVNERRPNLRAVRRGAFMTNETFHAWRESSQTLEGIAAYGSRSYTLTGSGEPVRLRGAIVSPALFPMLRAVPIAGGLFEPGADRAGTNQVALIAETTWTNRFNRDPSIVGRAIVLDGLQHTIVGVLPQTFEFPSSDVEIWTPFVVEPASTNPNERRVMAFPAIALLRDGVPISQAEAEGTTILQRVQMPRGFGGPGSGPGGPGGTGPVMRGPGGPVIRRAGPGTDAMPAQPSIQLVGLQEEMVAGVRPALLVLVGTVGFVLLIASANVANLLLARGAARQRELAVRSAIGAGRGRLVRQALTESVVLALAGGAVGLVVAWWLVGLLPAVTPGTIPRMAEVSVDLRVLAFTLGLSTLTGLIFGLVPALHTMRLDVVRAITEGSAASMGGLRPVRGNRSRAALVVAEVALALVLLVGAGLLLNSFVRLIRMDPGYDPANVLTAQISLPRTKYPTPETQGAFFDQALERASAIPGVASAGVTNLLPLTRGNISLSFEAEGQPPPGPDEPPPTASLQIVSPRFFDALGIQLRDGRPLGDQDRAGTARVAVVNQALAAKYFDGSPVGRRLNDFLGAGNWEIVGVVGDVRAAGLDSAPQPEAYVSYRQVPQMAAFSFAGFGAWVILRAEGDPLALVALLRREILAVDPELPIDQVMTMEARLSQSVAEPRFYAVLIGAFAVLAFVLAVVGIYGVLSYTVSQRHREIGVRMALGAQRPDILRLVLRQGLLLILVGLAIGLAGSLGVTRFLKTMLFGVTPTDPLTFVGVPLLLLLVALAACYVPARRATKVDPIQALRYE